MTPAERKRACLEAFRAARSLLGARGWAPSSPWVDALGPTRGAQPRSGPVGLTQAFAETQGQVYRDCSRALLRLTGSASLTVWEAVHTAADAFAVLEAGVAALDAAQANN